MAGVEVGDAVQHGERRPNGALGVVAVGHRCSEESHDGVADELFDGAAERLDVGPHPVVVQRQDVAHVFRIESLGTTGEAHQVDEDHGDDPPLLMGPFWYRGELRTTGQTKPGYLRVVLRAGRTDWHSHRLQVRMPGIAVVPPRPLRRLLGRSRRATVTRVGFASHGVSDSGPMDLRFTEEQERFRLEVRDWLEANAPSAKFGREPFASLDTAAGSSSTGRGSGNMFDARLSVVSWPERYGGRGAGLWEWVVFEEEYYRAEAPTRVGQNGIFLLAPTMFEFGTQEQKDRFLPPMASGEEIWCQGWSEPDAGSDLACIRQHRTPERPDGDLGAQRSEDLVLERRVRGLDVRAVSH